MLRRWRIRPLGGVVALGTLAALATMMAMAAPGRAEDPLREYSSVFEAQCDIAPNVFNIQTRMRTDVRWLAPSTVYPGEQLDLTEASSDVTSPVGLSETLNAFGIHELRGLTTRITIDTANLEPRRFNLARPVEYPVGLPFLAGVEAGSSVAFDEPSLARAEVGRSFTYGPLKITGEEGQVAKLTVNHGPPFGEEFTELSFFALSGEGIQAEVEGLNAQRERVFASLEVGCQPPPGAVVAEIPIGPPPTTTTTTTTTRTTTTTTAAGPPPSQLTFERWTLSGAIKDRKLKEPITLPEGCTFDGQAAIPGALEGVPSCPPFDATLKILNLFPTSIGMTLSPAEPVRGTVTAGLSAGEALFEASAEEDLSIHSIALLGLTIPTNCRGIEPELFPLAAEAPDSGLTGGITFTGETTVPHVVCGGGFLGAVFGPVLSELISGSGNTFTMSIEP